MCFIFFISWAVLLVVVWSLLHLLLQWAVAWEWISLAFLLLPLQRIMWHQKQ